MILKLSDIRFKPKFNINYGLSIFSINDILKYPKDYNIDYNVFLPSINKNLQRDFCWTLEQKQELIISILKGITINSMVIIQSTNDYGERDKKVYKVIDGKQRLSTIISFAKGEFPIIFNNQEYFISDLDDWGKRAIFNYDIKADTGYEYPDKLISDEDKINWFNLINWAGTPQDKKHMESLLSKD